MKLLRIALVALLAVFPLTVPAQNTANLTFRQNGTGDDFAGWFTATINSFSSPAWPFGQVGTTIRIVCVDRDNFITDGTIWNVRVNYLSNPNYKSMRRGYYPDAEARYKKAAYIYTKIPNTAVADRAPLYNMINFLVGLRSGVAPLDTALLTEVNTWYNAGAYGINWSEVAVLTDINTALTAIGDTIPAQGGAQEFMAFARPQTPSLLPWKKGQQLLIVAPTNLTTTGLRESQTAAFQAYARTSAGVPVAAPLVTWNLVASGASIQSTTNVSAVVGTAATLTGQTTAKLVGTWSTRSGVFRDSVLFPIIATSTTLPWQPRQQVLTLVSDTTTLTYNSKVVLTTYTRTSTGVLVSAPKITYTVSNPLVKLNLLNNQSVQLVMPAQQVPQFTVWAEWKTSSGALTSQTVFTPKY